MKHLLYPNLGSNFPKFSFLLNINGNVRENNNFHLICGILIEFWLN